MTTRRRARRGPAASGRGRSGRPRAPSPARGPRRLRRSRARPPLRGRELPTGRRRLDRHGRAALAPCLAARSGPQRADIGAASGGIGAGRSVVPISHSSTAAAHERPSAIAQTIRLWPRPMSPQTNTPSTFVAHVVAGDVAPIGELDAELLEQALALRTDEAHREQHELGRELEVGALDLLEDHAAVDELLLDLVGAQRPHVAGLVAEEALGVHREDPLAALFVRARGAVDERPGRPGVRVGRVSGGRGRISNWCTDAAP